MRKKVLIIAYLFAPIAGIGVLRPLKMVKYLPKNDWEPVVLTVKPPAHLTQDESLLKELPEDVEVYRTSDLNIGSFYLFLKGKKKSEIKQNKENSFKAKEQPKREASKLKQIIFKYLKNIKNYFLIPDDHILWLPFAVLTGLKAIKKNKISVLYSTSFPYSNHLVAYILAKITKLPWIADFRDPWSENMHRSGIKWRDQLEEKLEKKVVEKADIVTTVSFGFARGFLKKNPKIRQIEVIYNGFDPADFQDIPAEKNSKKFTISYTGIFYQERNPRLFLQGLKELLDEGKIKREDILVNFAGIFDYPGYSENRDAVREFKLEDVVEIKGYLPHKESLRLLKNSDLLLMIGDLAPGLEGMIQGKLYEYMAVKRPILALSQKGEATAIIEDFHLGIVVDPLDLGEIKNALLTFYEGWQKKELTEMFSYEVDREKLSKFQRDKQAEELSKLLNQLT